MRPMTDYSNDEHDTTQDRGHRGQRGSRFGGPRHHHAPGFGGRGGFGPGMGFGPGFGGPGGPGFGRERRRRGDVRLAILGLLAAEITAVTGKDPSERYQALTERFGAHWQPAALIGRLAEQNKRFADVREGRV